MRLDSMTWGVGASGAQRTVFRIEDKLNVVLTMLEDQLVREQSRQYLASLRGVKSPVNEDQEMLMARGVLLHQAIMEYLK